MFSTLWRLLVRAVDDGAVGVVLTHGTDTLEETAYFLDLLWDREEPLVVTGAMRSPNLPGADGPANLLSAVVAASSEEARGLGVLVVLDDTVSPRQARVENTLDRSVDFPVARVGAGGQDRGTQATTDAEASENV